MQQKLLTFLQLKKMFKNEESCREHLFKVRWSNGFKCPKCGHTEYYEIKSRHLFQCTKCQHQASVTSGTIFHKTRVSLVIWFWVMYLVRQSRFIATPFRSWRMDVTEDLSKETIQGVIIANTKEDSTIKTDGYSSYLGLKDCGFKHDRRISNGVNGLCG